ncbi:MAG: phosphohydrolase, partial [Treponema sp.]|nr:phosphohydrolase [Treponema sp.]
MLIFFIVVFLASTIVSFYHTATSKTVDAFNLTDYEVGQIADKNIYARSDLLPDIENPIAVKEGERIIRKGFAITEEEYNKLKKLSEAPDYIDYRAFADKELFLLLIFALYFCLFSPVFIGRIIENKELILHGIFFILVYGVTTLVSKTTTFSSSYS